MSPTGGSWCAKVKQPQLELRYPIWSVARPDSQRKSPRRVRTGCAACVRGSISDFATLSTKVLFELSPPRQYSGTAGAHFLILLANLGTLGLSSYPVFGGRKLRGGTRMTTMIVDPPRRTTMGVGFQSNRGRAGDPQAWKRALGTRPVGARLSLLPDSKPLWDRIGLSAAGQISILIFLLLIPVIFPQHMKTALKFQIVELMQPVTEIPFAPPPPWSNPNLNPRNHTPTLPHHS